MCGRPEGLGCSRNDDRGLHRRARFELALVFSVGTTGGNGLARKGIHQPGDSYADHEKQQEAKQSVFDSHRERAMPAARKRDRNEQRENQHRAKVAQMPRGDKHSDSPSAGDPVCIDHAEYVHDSRSSDEARAVVARGAGNIRSGSFEEVRDEIENAAADIRNESEQPKRVRRMG